MDFKLKSKFAPMGDQPQAIEKLASGLQDGLASQILLGVTGSGKTFTIANIIEKVNRPALVIAHNKTLAAQLCEELKDFFPENKVEFFVSYYDYYQPESYIVSTDTFIEKDSSINEEIDKLRHSATSSLIERNDVIVVASVSCIYGLGAPEEYYKMQISVRKGANLKRDDFIRRLIGINYKRNDIEVARTNFRVKGDIIDVFPANYSNKLVRVEFFGNTVESISEINTQSFRVVAKLEHIAIMPATHFVQNGENVQKIVAQIKDDLNKRLKELEGQNKMLEAYRLKQRVEYDCEMILQIGYCSGIENYSRYFDNRPAGSPPYTLLDYFPKDFVMFIDECHMTLPQIRAMYNGDKARKTNLIDYGFRLPSAADNRPLKFEEFRSRQPQTVYVSATPSEFELSLAGENIAEQIIRPTGLLDPVIEVRKTEGQIADLLKEIEKSVAAGGRVLITTLTKKMAETLSTYLVENKVKAKYLHSDIDTLERIKIIGSLRKGDFNVLVGINLLREGLDIPEVNLVAIIDADKEGFLRSRTSLIQTVGRAARNANSKVLMYADVITDSMKAAINETERRRKIQQQYNSKHGITPKTIVKDVRDSLKISTIIDGKEKLSKKEKTERIQQLRAEMALASANLDFELAIALRDEIKELQSENN